MAVPATRPDVPSRKADAEQLRQFIDALFRYCSGGWVSFRAFFEDSRRKAPLFVRAHKLDDGGLADVITTAIALATRAASNPEPSVFAPPICTFRTGRTAAEADVAEAPTLSVELDANPRDSCERLEGLLGPATVVMRSGGVWTDPGTGECHDKLHAHWRLTEPASDAEDLALLKRMRGLAAGLVGGDPTAVPPCHPLRWAGSWHLKAAPRLAEIVELRGEAELELRDAASVLEDAARLAGVQVETAGRPASNPSPIELDADLAALVATIPNEAAGEGPEDPVGRWNDWNRVGMALWAATGGSDAGLVAFQAWSAKRSDIYDADVTLARWQHYVTSAPKRLTAGTLVYLARKAQPDFRLPSWDLEKAPPEPEALPVDISALPEPLQALIEGDPRLADAWSSGRKLTKGTDQSANGLEFSLAVYLAVHRCDDALIELALRHYPFGQVRDWTEARAERRIEKLLEKVTPYREKAERRAGAAAWFGDLLTGQEGVPRDCLVNGVVPLRQDPELSGRLAFDEHRGAVMCRDMPWRPGDEWREWTNTDDLRLAEWLQLREVPLKPNTCAEAVGTVADDHRNHPIRNYLDGLVWDGVPRLDRWLHDYLGVGPCMTGYVREVGRRWPISGVARIYRLGCKADHALVLEGGQGAGKSSALAALIPMSDWFADEISDLGSKDSAQDLRGKWLLELAELSALRRGEIERVKAFMSRGIDHYRPSYGRRSQDFPRQCFFAGTTNADTYLADETGNRRWWPVKVGRIDLEALKRDRDQLWAEAVAAYKAGEIWWLPGEVERHAGVEQAQRRNVDAWEEKILEWVTPGTDVRISEILSDACIGMPIDRQDQKAQNRVAQILVGAGYRRQQRRLANGKRRWVYRLDPVTSTAPPVTTVSPLGEGATSPTASRAVTTVTSVTTKNDVCVGGPEAVGETAQGAPQGATHFDSARGKLSETLVSTGDSGDRRPPWTDDQAWLGQIASSRKADEQVGILHEWAVAAGGGIISTGGSLLLELPRKLPQGLALTGLQQAAQELRVPVQMTGTLF